MKGKAGKILFGLMALMLFGATAQAATFTAAMDGDWATATTWTLNSGMDDDGIPDADDAVTIPTPRVVTVSSAQSAQNLTVNSGGTLTINGTLTMSGTPSSSVSNSGTVNGTGSLRTQGTTNISIGGTFTAPLVVASGTTTTASSNLGGSISVLSGATLQVPAGGFVTTHTGDLTVASGGTLNIGSSSAFVANGANIVNNGTVSGNAFRFQGTTQNLSGTGSFTNGSITIFNGSTTTLTSDITFGNGNTTATNFTVNSGGTLTLSGSNTLTLNGVGFSSSGTVNGSGTLRTQLASSVSIGGTFTAPLVVASGTTNTNSSTIGGSISVLSGATLQVPAGGFVTTHTGDLTVASGGTLNIGSSSRFDANGANIVNNGTVSGNVFRFQGATQNLSGTGSFTTSSITIFSGSTTTLTSNITFGNGNTTATNFTVNGGGILAIGGNTLTLNGVGFSSGGTVTSASGGIIRMQAMSSLDIGGAFIFTAALEINSGTTTTAGSNLGGSISVLSGATLQVPSGGFVTTHTGDLTINTGGILDIGSSSAFVANGANIVNNGTVSNPAGSFRFNGTAQNLSGTGSFINGTITILSGSTTTLTSNITFGNGNTTATNFTVNSGGTLTLSGSNTLTLNGVGFSSSGTVNGSGTLRTQLASSVSISGTFTAPLVVASGTTTTASSTIGGSISVLSGATLQVPAGGFFTTHTGDLTVASGGTLNIGSGSTFAANGANIVNNGTVSGNAFRFNRTGAQTLSGTGAFTNTSLQVLSGSSLTLGSNHQFLVLTINSGGAFNTATFTAFLNGAGTPLFNNGTAITGNFTYNGTAAQTVQTTNVNYTQLGIDNAAGVTLPAAETVSSRLILTNGAFNNSTFLTLASGATIERSNGTLQTAPTLAGMINVEYTGATDVTTGVELPVSTTALTNLIINKATATNTVTLDASRTVNGALTLTNGRLITTASFTIFVSAAGTSTGSAASFVVGTIQKAFAAPAPFTYHVGTATGYSPATINVDAGAGTFAASATNGVIPASGLDPNKTLQRYWSLTNGGITQGDLTFQYQQADVPGTAIESQFRVTRNNGGANNSFFTPSALDITNNIATLNNVTQFSDWTLFDLGPTSAPADIGGRVTRADGSPVAGVRLKLVNSASSQTVARTTDNSGSYLFPEIPTGVTYIITAERRGYLMTPANRVFNHNGGRDDLNFTANRDLSTQEATSGSDFDGDGRADLAVFRPENGTWYIKRSSDDSFHAQQFGADGDVPTAGDYDGDGKSDYAVFRPADKVWYLLRSRDNTFFARAFGAAGDVPAQGDYDGDGKTDRAVYRPSDGIWYIWQSGNEQLRSEPFGASADKIVPADYDGDGKTDVAVYRPSEGIWYILQSGSGQIRAQRFGVETDEPAIADYDGDGKADVAVYRRSEGVWHILKSADGNHTAIRWGASDDALVPADYDGDGKSDVAIFRSGDWHISLSGSGTSRAERFGKQNDKPIPNTF